MPSNNINPITEESFYHIYNRAVGDNKLFYQDRNYTYFLANLNEYLSDFLELYAYCLLPNHFHLLCYIKSIEIDGVNISEAFRRFFITYSQAINVQEEIKGSLFMKPFKRKIIEDENHLLTVISYLHLNPIKHGISKDYCDYKWSSYNDIFWGNNLIKWQDVIKLFGSIGNFEYHHKIQSKMIELVNRDAIAN